MEKAINNLESAVYTIENELAVIKAQIEKLRKISNILQYHNIVSTNPLGDCDD